MSFPFIRQPDAMDCGPACLKMIAEHYGRKFTIDSIRKKCYLTREGVSFLGLSEAADSLGFRTVGVRIDFDTFKANVPMPCIVHWRQKHFIVVYRIKGRWIYAADPAVGLTRYTVSEFMSGWATTTSGGNPSGLVLIIEPTPSFYEKENEHEKTGGFMFLYKYFRLYKKYFLQLIISLVLASLIQLIIPLLTRSIIDTGINNDDIGFIYLILAAQLALIIGRMSVEFIRGWLLLHIGTRVNVAIISGFLQKLMALPLSFFDTRMTGDILQRIEDNNRIEEFLTSTSLGILFSLFNIFIFGIVLAIFSTKILLIFLAGSLLYAIWISLFMKKRGVLDKQRFKLMSESGTKLINLINGMQEIKLTRSEVSKRWDWELHQASMFRLKVRGLGLNQYQTAGATLLNEVTGIIITIIAATSVLHGSMTLGMMLAVQFIIGQLNGPVSQIIYFFRLSQDARMSLDRIAEVQDMEEEEQFPELKVSRMPAGRDIYINGVSFQYEGPHSPFVLKDVDLHIPAGKVTAIVGTSGSGKTTLLKTILGFYNPVRGEIIIGDTRLSNLSLRLWREKAGAVMQGGHIFPDTIAYNIAPGINEISEERLLYASGLANIRSFIDSLPLGFNTKIGANGLGLSEGQKQRILIARAVYKDPDFLFLDEATNSLDAATEKAIVENLGGFFSKKTVVVVAHRLSTVRSADKIVVLDGGRITESGTHEELSAKQGEYFNLVKNQLELGS